MAAPHFPEIGQIPPVAPKRKEPTEADELRARAERAEASERDANVALRETVAARTPPPPIDPASVRPPDPGEMPDNVAEPEKFQKWTLATRDRDNWDSRNYTDRTRDTAVSAARSEKIIDDYMVAHPKYQGLREQVYIAFRDACVELKIKVLPDDPSRLNTIVDGKMKELLKITAAATDDLPSGDPKGDKEREAGRETPPEHGAPPSRTEGLSAGSRGNAAGGTPPKEEDEVPIKPLVDVLLERQAKSGFF